MIKFCPLVSGSSGNSTYIGTEYTHLLIDAGVSGKKIEDTLLSININCKNIDGIFITHEHIDHIKGAGIISRRFDIPIYATEGTWSAMEESLGKISRKNKKIIYSGEKLKFNDMCIKPFDIPHDAAEPVGFNIFAGDTKITVATDIGHANDTVKEAVADSAILLLEANHDIDLLKHGSYPYNTKKRILSDYGHMANINAGKLLSEVMSRKIKHIYLGHLSAENNTPSLAYKSIDDILYDNGIHAGKDFVMKVALRNSASTPITI
ncbi:MAG: MBL fold metallo-hydrolase [Firmicutes bacterium]|nr:MBL fold metallo-hydrolase [Bacillota bacterium]